MITFEKLDEMITLVPGLKEAYILLEKENYDATLKHIKDNLGDKAEIHISSKEIRQPYFYLWYKAVAFHFRANC